MPEIVLDLFHHEAYEVGATLVACLAHPGPSDRDKTRDNLHETLCAVALITRCEMSPEWAAAPQWIKPSYACLSEQTIERDLKTVERRLRDRMVAARMVMPFLQRAQTGVAPDLPPGVKRWSLNEMAEFVRKDARQSDPQNVKSRIWRPSEPVIHLAAAVAVLGQEIERVGAGSLDTGYLVQDRWVIEGVVRRAQEYEALLPEIRGFTIDPEKLVRLRLA
jgi:hypothetical protein